MHAISPSLFSVPFRVELFFFSNPWDFKIKIKKEKKKKKRE
jgi:type III secretory pathway component EscR